MFWSSSWMTTPVCVRVWPGPWRSRGLPSQAFDSAVAFDALLQSGLRETQACCLLLDVRMPVSGLALFERMIERDLCQTIPVIFLTGHADLPTAVDAVKRGAFDFCEKPVSDNALVDRVNRLWPIGTGAAGADPARAGRRTHAGRPDRARTGRDAPDARWPSNKLIADQLQISVRTVEVHRARVFDKMRVKSAVELANALQHR